MMPRLGFWAAAEASSIQERAGQANRPVLATWPKSLQAAAWPCVTRWIQAGLLLVLLVAGYGF